LREEAKSRDLRRFCGRLALSSDEIVQRDLAMALGAEPGVPQGRQQCAALVR
jgi:hypothetical protein